jgi:hypothetical protein
MRFKDFIHQQNDIEDPLEQFHELLHHIAEEELPACKVHRIEARGKDGVDIYADCQDRPREEGHQPDLTEKLVKRLKLHPLQDLNSLRPRVFHKNVDAFELGEGLKDRATDWLNNVEEIKARCQPFLRSTDMPLYRGIGGLSGNSIIKAKTVQVNKNRKPRDSHPAVQKLIDDWFEKRWGVRPRQSALFCSGRIKVAEYYGRPFYVFPVGKFKIIWGVDDKYRDALVDSLYLSNKIEGQLKVAKDRSPEHEAEITDSFMKTVQWNTTDLEDAQLSGGEIMLLCDEVILVPVSNAPEYADLLERIHA